MVAAGDPVFAVPDAIGSLVELDPGAEFLNRLVGVRLADEQEVSTRRQHGLANRLAGEQIVAEIDRLEPRIPRAMRRQPAARGTAFAILLVVPILRNNEFRLQRHDPVMSRRDKSGGEHGVEILDLVPSLRLGQALAAFAMGTVRATDLVRAMEFGAVERDQYMPVQAAHGVQAAALDQFGHEIGEHGMEHRWLDRIELGAYLAVAGDFARAEQGLAVRAALTGLQMALMGQKGRALHEERGEPGQGEIGHVVRRVQASPLVRQGPAAPTQGIEEAVQDWHKWVES
jgi:hypothetical protein